MLELVLEGKVEAKSGKLLIIDPCYLEDFDWDSIDKIDDERDKTWMNILDAETEASKKYTAALKLDQDLSDEELVIVAKSFSQASEEYMEASEKIKLAKDDLRKIPSFIPPYLVQSDNFLAIRNGIGDGLYPVTRTSDGFNLVFNFPMRNGVANKKRLGGQFVGNSAVDSATQVISDLNRFKIKPILHRDSYCVIEGNGLYICKFIDDNDALSIRKR